MLGRLIWEVTVTLLWSAVIYIVGSVGYLGVRHARRWLERRAYQRRAVIWEKIETQTLEIRRDRLLGWRRATPAEQAHMKALQRRHPGELAN